MKYIFRTRLLPLFLIFVLGIQQYLTAQDLESKIDQVLETKFKSNGPGAVFLATKNGKIIYNKAFGLSNLELQVPMQTDNVFEIGSMTKQFTAVAILMLMEEGKLNLEDSITKFIPDYPTYGHRITIHHLLTHTSGIKDFTKVKGLNAIAHNHMEPMEIINFFKDEPMDFAPGAEFKYNNSGYVLLGYIIEKASEMSYEDFVEQRIFKKLGMSSSRYASHSEVVPKRASGYHKKEDYINARHISFSIPYASGSLMSTVADMFTWEEAMKNHVLLNKETTQLAFTNYTLNNGDPIHYGYGWHVKEMEDMFSYEHGGSIFGFKSMGVYLPQEDIYVIGLSNCDCNSPTEVTREIAKMVLETNQTD
ncbi:CubicO group peptidase, beta-lactamase class C family [Flagellimonas taeanensis]|uniref:CubicO group peptidase, beta-lactamase class C family n=1 Tax=Flagellimonas taeanensis TaxID=1005926 RepID=A0A1M6QJZ4_9FLAO|nr:serine hydrolase domain-containing protein [Allomuricauda taeanensis]SFB71273.1 CubicO group peptidase, beta-lactamase class C family [Allomuricauda taeanensis]SHK20536.1 CubicO group peptidase, beta-lactamase class C family [Allomuricauda taeanensis]